MSGSNVAVFLALCFWAVMSPAWSQTVDTAQSLVPKEEVVPAQPFRPALPPANAAAAATVRDLAARVRALKLAPEPLSGNGSRSILGQPVPAGVAIPIAPKGAVSAKESKPSFEPRLIAIVGSRGKERVELALDGVVYTVSLRHPALGTTGWRLTDVNTDDVFVRIAGGDEASRRKGLEKAYLIGFSRRDPDFQARVEQQSPTPLLPGVPIAGFPAR